MLPNSAALGLAAVLFLSGFPVPTLADAFDPGSCPASDSLIVRALRFEGLKATRETIVRRELEQVPGSAFSCAVWERERIRLEDLDIFAEVRLRAASDTLVYTFRELPPYIPFVSAILTEQDGFSMGPALASLNFLGRDIRLEAMARFGGTTEFMLSAGSPWLGSWPVEYDVAAIWVDSWNPFEKFHEDSRRIKFDFRHRLGDGRANLLYHGEVFLMHADRDSSTLASDSSLAARANLSPGWDFIPRAGLGFLWDGRDRRHGPRRGLYQEARVTQNGGWLGGDADYLEWLTDTRLYLPWSRRNVLFLGALYQFRTGREGTTFPVYDRFHAGGVNTLRGFGHDALRGKSEWIATVENRVDLFRKRVFSLWSWNGYFGLQGVAGWEAASLWGHDALVEGGFESGAYLGMHLILAGVDRVRFEVGSNSAKLDFRWGLGILEKADVQRFRAR